MKFTKIAKRHGGWFISCVISALALAYLLIRGNAMIADVVDQVLAGENVEFEKFILLLLAMSAGGFVVAFIRNFSKNTFSVLVQNDFKNEAADKITRIEYRYFDEEGSGSVLNKMVSDINEVGRLFSETMPETVIGMITFLAVTVYMFIMDVRLTLLVLICYPVMFAIVNYVSHKLQKLTDLRRRKLDERTEIAYDGINGIVIGRSYNLFQVVRDRLFVVIEEVFRNEEARTRISTTSYVMEQVISWIPTICCYVFALLEIISGHLTVGEMIAFVVLLDRMTHSIGEFPYYINDFREIGVSMRRLEDICAQPDEHSGSYEMKKEDTACEDVITFENISFSYAKQDKTGPQEQDYIFKDLGFTIKKGSTTAFVGGSGQGKSTAFRIICGFYPYQQGSYRLFGKEFTDWNLESARRQFALVSQNVFLFPDTILTNVAYGRKGATREDVITACKMANIHDFIMNLPDGYDTMAGERGVRLSGGERQRISIARAFLKNAPILLLDEPTSAVDVKTENLIQEAIDRISEDRTVIIIAHRLNTIQDADTIFVFDGGRIVEKGTHEELLHANGAYTDLYGKECRNGGMKDEQPENE